nr:MAG TPA: hypothetical protein [Caudoviricetes sp.]
MGYESKLYVCKRVKIGEWPCYNEVLAAMNMGKMDSDFVRLFDEKLDGDFFGMDGAMSRFDQCDDEDEPKLVGTYGDELKYTSLDRVLGWCDEYMDNTDEFPYWRIVVLQEMLASFDIHFKQLYNEQLIVVHYGY